MPNRLRSVLERSRAHGRGTLVGYLPAGYPDPNAFTTVVRDAVAAGLQVLELGLPGPAPFDGPVIQAAVEQARADMHDIGEALALAAPLVPNDGAIIALAYRHHLELAGPEGLVRQVAEGGADALLVPGLTMHEQLELAASARSHGLEPVIFLHLQEELAILAGAGLDDPVIYLQSADTQTGGHFRPDKVQERMSELTAALGRRPRNVLVGFGVRGEPEVDTCMAVGAAGAVIGTALVVAAADDARYAAQSDSVDVTTQPGLGDDPVPRSRGDHVRRLIAEASAGLEIHA